MRPPSRIGSRRFHRWAGAAAALPLGLVIATGLLLQLKKVAPWVQPPTRRGAAFNPGLGWEAVLKSVRTVPEAGIRGWGDVSRIDLRPERGLIKVLGRNRWEVQLDAADGRVLQAAYRRSDLIESLHDGSFFSEGIKLGVFLPAGALLLGLWASGLYLWLQPYLVRARNGRRLPILEGGRTPAAETPAAGRAYRSVEARDPEVFAQGDAAGAHRG